jgi:hypothetical protein
MTGDRRAPRLPPRPNRRPAHPTAKALVLMVGFLLAIFALALMSTFSSH